MESILRAARVQFISEVETSYKLVALHKIFDGFFLKLFTALEVVDNDDLPQYVHIDLFVI